MKIELYLDPEKGMELGESPYGETSVGRSNLRRRFLDPASDASCSVIKRAFVGFTDKEKKIMNMLEQIAAQHNLELRIYDVSKTIPAFRAWYKRVHDLPTVIIGRKKLTKNLTKELIIKILAEQMCIAVESERKREVKRQR